MKTKRLGQFVVDLSMIDDACGGDYTQKAALNAMFAKCIVIRAECRYDRNAIEYVAVSDSFDELQFGEMAPYYCAEITRSTSDLAGQEVETFNVRFVRSK